MDLNDTQWKYVSKEIPKHKLRKDGKVRPWCDDRQVLNGILWILRTGAPWRDLPSRYPFRATCHRRFQEWGRSGVFKKIWRRLIHLLDKEGKLDWSEGFIDGSFANAKKGGLALVKLRGGKAQSGWPSLMVMDYLSEFLFTPQHLTKSRLLRRPLKKSRALKNQKISLVTKPTPVKNWLDNFSQNTMLNSSHR